MKPEGGQNWMPITPSTGSILHAETQSTDLKDGLALAGQRAPAAASYVVSAAAGARSAFQTTAPELLTW